MPWKMCIRDRVYPKDLEETYSPDSYRSAMETAGYTSGEKSVSVTMLVNEENSFKRCV